jgi:hypothetical protein
MLIKTKSFFRNYVDSKGKPIIFFNHEELINEKSGEKLCEIFRHCYYDIFFRVNEYFDPYYIHYSNNYFIDLNSYLEKYKNNTNQNDIEYLFTFGDCTKFKEIPTFVKAKTIENSDFSVLLKLNTPRHIGMINTIKKLDIPFNNKKNILLWRGDGITGRESGIRKKVALQYQNCENTNIDIKIVRLFDNDVDYNKFIIADKMSYEEMLEYKFLLSIEGNDVASNLKWALFSKSVVIMAKPTKCSWFMEDKLIPFVHYVPVNDDYDNIEEMYIWCMNNLEKCEEISKNATEYMKIFLDEENENYITNEVLKGYFNNVKFE